MKYDEFEARPFDELEAKINYVFKDKKLIATALTRSSFANEQKARHMQVVCNERLEFLGDSVLSFITAEYIFENYKKLPEGELTKLRAAVVCEGALFDYSKQLDLGVYLYIGNSEVTSGGRERRSTLADAFEALLAAIYLDSGIDEAKSFVLPFITSNCESILKSGEYDDCKSRLQAFIQQTKGDVLEYRLIDESGPAHMRSFTVAVYLNNNRIGTGTGTTKRAAEQKCAREALMLFGEINEKGE